MNKVLIALLLSSTVLLGLTKSQLNIKRIVKEKALKHKVNVKIVESICYTESSYGLNLIGDFDHSWGCMQLGKLAIYDVANKYKKYKFLKHLPISRLKTIMVRNDRLNIELGVLYFKILINRHKTIDRAIMAYNTLYLKNGRLNKAYLSRINKSRKTK